MKQDNSTTVKPWIHKYANVEDATTGDSFEVFAFRKTLDRKGKLRIERDKAREPRLVLAALAKKNAVLPFDESKAVKLITAAMKSEPRRYRLHVRNLGWLPRGEGFVLKRTVLATRDGDQELRPPLWVNDRQVGMLKSRGTLQQWQQHVARRAVYSSRLMLALAAAFAAPLVKVSGLQNFGINIFGKSKVGKTTALLVSASAIGIGTERDLPNWNATSNAFLETARGFNDLVLPANEVGLLAGKRRDAYAPIRERIYAFSEGRDRARLSSSTMATSWRNSSWRGIFLSTSEYSFNDYAAFSGEERSAGEYARCLDVHAVTKGHTTIFDSYPQDVAAHRRKRWARAQLTELRENCTKFHGMALEPYVGHLIELSGQLRPRVEKHCAMFMDKVRAMRLDGALTHAGRNFALVYAGGCLAIEAKILPWSEPDLIQAIEACFEAAVDDIRGHTNSVPRARAILKAKLQSQEIVAAQPNATILPKRCAGYWTEESGDRVYTIHTAAFRRWFSSRAQAVAVLRWLWEQGTLVLESGKAKPSLNSVQWAVRTRRWPGGKVVKCIRIRQPFPTVPKNKPD